MRPEPQGHKPAIARNSMVLPVPGSPTMSTRSPGAISTCRSLSVVQPVGVAISRFSKRDLAAGRLDELDPVLGRAEPVHRHNRLAEARDAQQSGAPVGDGAEIIDEPPQGLLHLNKGADDHHQRAEGKIAAEVSRRRNQDRRDDREPAVTCRDPGEPRARADDPPHHAENVLELGSEALLLILFAAIERHAVTMLVEAHEREAQIGLPGVALGIELGSVGGRCAS